MSAEKKADPAETLKVNEQKWSKPLMDAGWTVMPNVIIERQRALGLDAIDINILMHLAVHWWTAENKPRPAKTTIAEAMNLTPRTVQRRIAAMEIAGLIKREERRIAGQGSKPNRYHFDGLIKEAAPYAAEKLQKMAEREKEKKEAAGRRGKPKLALVKNEDDE